MQKSATKTQVIFITPLHWGLSQIHTTNNGPESICYNAKIDCNDDDGDHNPNNNDNEHGNKLKVTQSLTTLYVSSSNFQLL